MNNKEIININNVIFKALFHKNKGSCTTYFIPVPLSYIGKSNAPTPTQASPNYSVLESNYHKARWMHNFFSSLCNSFRNLVPCFFDFV